MESEKQLNELLFSVYYNIKSPAAFSSVDRIYSYIKSNHNITVKKSFIEKWLSKQETYSLHRNRRLNFTRNRYNITNIDDLWQIDLIDVQKISRKNKGNRYILAIIDCFSKFAFCIPIKRKTPDEVINAFKKLFKSTHRRPLHIQSDKGLEFRAKKVVQFFKDNNINFYTASDPKTKAAICERFIRTIKSIIYKYFTFTKTERYIDVLDSLVFVYNHRRHRTIKMQPAEVNASNILQVWKNINERSENNIKKKAKFQIGDFVRISLPKKTFEKGYRPLWSNEIFLVEKICFRKPVVYVLQDQNNIQITGVFYEPELQKIDQNHF